MLRTRVAQADYGSPAIAWEGRVTLVRLLRRRSATCPCGAEVETKDPPHLRVQSRGSAGLLLPRIVRRAWSYAADRSAARTRSAVDFGSPLSLSEEPAAGILPGMMPPALPFAFNSPITFFLASVLALFLASSIL